MNRRQKIIVSVTGIFIVLLILIGLTYAYFLTRITGNGNPTSISVTTANLELVYGDGTTAILTSENPLMPSSTPIGTKDFTVTNNGDDSEYVVVFEDVTVKYAENTVIDGEAVAKDTPTTFESNDFVYTLTCTVKDKNGNTTTDKSCDGVEEETFPMDGGIVVGNSIDKNEVDNYVLTLYYLDNGLDQSADMNKALNGKINIKDIKSINPYSDNTESLAYNIINNSMLNKNGTELRATPLTKVAEEISSYSTTQVETVREYYPNWEEGGYAWEGLTYGTTQELADYGVEPLYIEEGTDPIEPCNSVKGQYISDSFGCFYELGCNSIGKVVDCESDGTPILEENDEYTSWSEGGYGWEYLTYGATQDLADYGVEPLYIEEGTDPIEACNSVKGQYISDAYSCNYDGCNSIGKVVDCESDGTPILEENYYEYEANKSITMYEQTLSIAKDNYGTSYYYRGNVEDNYVNFAGMCWRIVRIQGDGSIKLILESQSLCSESMTSDISIGNAYWGFITDEKDNKIGDYKNSTRGMKSVLTSWLNATDENDERTNITTNAEKLLKTEEWCLGNTTKIYAYNSPYGLLGTTASENYASRTSFYYETGRNLYGNGVTPNATLKCNGEIDSSKIGALTADEVVFAGGKAGNSNPNYYLQNDSYNWWTLSRSFFSSITRNDYPGFVNQEGLLRTINVDNSSINVRPAVSLNTNVKITSGEGTKGNPYIIAD